MATEITDKVKSEKPTTVFRTGNFSFWIKPVEGKKRTVKMDYSVYPHQNRSTLGISFADYTSSINSPRKAVSMGGIACIHNVYRAGKHKYGISTATKQDQSIGRFKVMRMLNEQLKESGVPLSVRGEVRKQVKEFMSLTGKFAK